LVSAGGLELTAEYLFASDASDTSGNGNDGTLEGDATASGTLVLDGTGDRVNVADHEMMRVGSATPFSVSFWFKPVDTGTDGLVSKYSSGHLGFLIYKDSINIKFRHAYSSTGNQYIETYSPYSYASGTWYHVAINYDGTELASGVEMYLNGSSATVSTSSDNITTFLPSLNTESFKIGDRGGSSLAFNGEVDSVYYKVGSNFDASEITDFYNEGHD